MYDEDYAMDPYGDPYTHYRNLRVHWEYSLDLVGVGQGCQAVLER